MAFPRIRSKLQNTERQTATNHPLPMSTDGRTEDGRTKSDGRNQRKKFNGRNPEERWKKSDGRLEPPFSTNGRRPNTQRKRTGAVDATSRHQASGSSIQNAPNPTASIDDPKIPKYRTSELGVQQFRYEEIGDRPYLRLASCITRCFDMLSRMFQHRGGIWYDQSNTMCVRLFVIFILVRFGALSQLLLSRRSSCVLW